jgi:hypothetical protein
MQVEDKSVFPAAAQFVQQRWALVLAVSAAVLVPCYWHKHIEAGDLGSHVYNAWLAELVRQGQLPGLWIVPQWNNVAFDLMLSALGKVLGWVWAEKLAVSLCVLVFFWGAFGLVSAAARRAPLFLIPVISIITYGWTFQQGFINYYLSLGLSFFALAILWRGKGKERIASLAFVPLILLAHPLGLLWLIGAGAYILAVEKLERYRPWMFGGAALLALFTGFFLQHRFVVYKSTHPLYLYNGADQIILYSRLYKVLAVAIASFIVAALASELWNRRNDSALRETGRTLLELYVVLQCLVLVMPFGVLLPGYKAPISFLPNRITTLSAVLICSLLALTRPRRWHVVGYATAAALFFALLYRDTGILNNMEEQSERIVANLPFGQRVLYRIRDPKLRLNIDHFVDRACINHCVSYGNYEPSTEQFRIRATPGNGTVMSEVPDVWRMENGDYRVNSSDLPAYEIYQCGDKGRDVCVRSLHAGEKNNPPLASRVSPFTVR